jgi:hypothetical protein
MVEAPYPPSERPEADMAICPIAEVIPNADAATASIKLARMIRNVIGIVRTPPTRDFNRRRCCGVRDRVASTSNYSGHRFRPTSKAKQRRSIALFFVRRR